MGPRPIPDESAWYGQPKYLIPLSGIYAILVIVVSMTSIISTYFCLNSENYHWQWNAFFSGASASIYVFLYGLYYFWFKTTMYGLLQTSFYFGYMTLISLSLGCLCGTIGFISSAKFVETIFRNVKVD